MSDNKKYYYLKLKDTYFEQDNIKILESMENGYIYSLILLKLHLKSIKYNGNLKMTESIPYSPENIEILSSVLNHDVAHVKETIRMCVKLDLITVMESGEIWLTDIQNFIGKSSTEADRIREYRSTITKDVQMYDKSTPELELELEREIELEKDIYSVDFEKLWSLYPRKQNKLGAYKAFKARLKDGVDIDYLMICLQNYITAVEGKEENYIMHGSTFFGPNKRYADYEKFTPQKNAVMQKAGEVYEILQRGKK